MVVFFIESSPTLVSTSSRRNDCFSVVGVGSTPPEHKANGFIRGREQHNENESVDHSLTERKKVGTTASTHSLRLINTKNSVYKRTRLVYYMRIHSWVRRKAGSTQEQRFLFLQAHHGLSNTIRTQMVRFTSENTREKVDMSSNTPVERVCLTASKPKKPQNQHQEGLLPKSSCGTSTDMQTK